MWPLTQQGFERQVGDMRQLVLHHTQRGGHCGSADSNQLYKISKAIENHMLLDFVFDHEILFPDEESLFDICENESRQKDNETRVYAYHNDGKGKKKRKVTDSAKQAEF